MKTLWILAVFLAIGDAGRPHMWNNRRWIRNTGEIDPGVFQVDGDLRRSGHSMAELVLSQEYPLEEYEVVTEDGYILTTFRIPYGKNKTAALSRQPILLQHGLFASSVHWVISEPRKGLGFVLADAGFDVWIGNSRGSDYGMKHIKYNPAVDKKEFFNYSVHEMGCYDLPAVIDLVLNKTKTSRITYIGHSEGTTAFYIMAATRPQYNQKIIVAATLAPVAYMAHIRGMTRILADFSGPIGRVAKYLDLYDITNDSPLLHYIDTALCKEKARTEAMCENFMFLFLGFDSQQFNKSLLPVIADIGSAGASIKQLSHFGQLATNDGKFAMYDYGWTENRRRYGQVTPPEYNLKNVIVPIHLHYSMNDWLATTEDVQKLHRQLPNSTLTKVPYPAFNHIDFMWAMNVREVLYDNMIAQLKTYLKTDVPLR